MIALNPLAGLGQAGEVEFRIGDAVISLKIFNGNSEQRGNRTYNPVPEVRLPSAGNLGNGGDSGGPAVAFPADGGHGKCLTLRDVWQKHMLPAYRDRRSTAIEYETAIGHFEREVGALPVQAIGDEHLEALVEGLTGKLAANTVRKVLRHLRAVIRRCGPRSSDNPQGLKLIDDLPWVQSPASDRKYVRAASVDETGRLFDAAAFLKYRPQSCAVDAVAWWRAQLVAVWFLGIRTANLFVLTPDAVRSDGELDGDKRLVEAGFRRPFDWAPGWLVYTPAKTARRKPFPLVIPLHPIARGAFDRLAANAPRGLLFGVPNFQSIKSRYYPHCRAWGEQAAIGWDVSLDNVRKACSTNFNDQHASLGAFVLGHAPGRSGDTVNAVHYDAVLGRLKTAVERVAYPKEFDAWA